MKKTILIVDDDDATLRAQKRVISSALGVIIVEAASRRSALKQLEVYQVDLLLTDNDMPNTGEGVRLIKQARERQPDLPVILTSGWEKLKVQQSFAEFGLEASDHVFIQKGSGHYVEELISTIKQLLEIS